MKATVAITHWPSYSERIEYLNQTLNAMSNLFLDWREYDVVVSILPVEDQGQVDEAVAVAGRFAVDHVVQDKHYGFTEHINHLKRCHPGPFMLVQDDWVLTREFRLESHLDLLERNPDIAMVHFTACRGVDPAPFDGEPQYEIVTARSGHAYADHPALHSPKLVEAAGEMPEGMGPRGEAKYNRAVRECLKNGEMRIAIMPVANLRSPALWRHIGAVRSLKREPVENALQFDFTNYGRTQQCVGGTAALERLIDWYKPDVIIELGAGNGNLTLALADKADCEVHAYNDIRQVRELHPKDNVWFHLGDIFAPVCLHDIFERITKAKRPMVLCDNGDKPKEVATFAPKLPKDGLIGVHDYGETRAEFITMMREPNRWRSCECVYEDIEQVVGKGFTRVWRDTFLNVAWAFFMVDLNK
jgi:hypothetical protein